MSGVKRPMIEASLLTSGTTTPALRYSCLTASIYSESGNLIQSAPLVYTMCKYIFSIAGVFGANAQSNPGTIRTTITISLCSEEIFWGFFKERKKEKKSPLLYARTIFVLRLQKNNRASIGNLRCCNDFPYVCNIVICCIHIRCLVSPESACITL